MGKAASKVQAIPFRGMMPVMPTPITESGEVDEESQRRLVRYCLECGAVAVGHLGGASEFYKVSEADRRRLTEIVVDAVGGRVPVFIGVTAATSRIAVSYAVEAEALGASMIMAAAPHVDLPDAPGMFEYYRALSEAVSIPIIIQDTPASGHLLTAPAMWRLYQELDNVCYAKVESERFLPKIVELQALSRGELHLIGGFAGKHLIHMLRAGVTAFMTGTEALDIHAAVVNAYLGGDEERAARIYFERLLPYLMFYLDCPWELLKAMLHRRGIIACPKVIPPPRGAPMSDIERREFDWILDRIGWSDDWPCGK